MLLIKTNNIRIINAGIYAILEMLNKDSKKSVQEVMLNYNCGKFEICEHYEIERAFYGGAKGYDYTGENKKVLATDFEIAFNAKNQIEVSTENQDYIQKEIHCNKTRY